MKCEQCVAEGKTSRVYGGDSCVSTLMGGGESYYDEDGKRHKHDPNGNTYSYHCSNRHTWSRTTYLECWCGYNKGKSD